MNLELGEIIGQASKRSGAVKVYRHDPSNFDAAAHAAFHYVKRDGKRMVIVPGNSYGRSLFHISEDTKSLGFFCLPAGSRVAVVELDGTVREAKAS